MEMEMQQDNKLGILARGGAMFVAISSALAFIFACAGLYIEGFETIMLIVVAVTLTLTYMFGIIGFTGYPPKMLNWLI
jgi:hypothetical protein